MREGFIIRARKMLDKMRGHWHRWEEVPISHHIELPTHHAIKRGIKCLPTIIEVKYEVFTPNFVHPHH